MFTHLVRMCDLTHFFCMNQAPLLSPTEHFSGYPTISSNVKYLAILGNCSEMTLVILKT
jgi:hypothetical protein